MPLGRQSPLQFEKKTITIATETGVTRSTSYSSVLLHGQIGQKHVIALLE